MSTPVTIAIEARANLSGITGTMGALRDLRTEAVTNGRAADSLRARWDSARGSFAQVRGELLNTYAAFGLLRGGVSAVQGVFRPFLDEMDRIGRLNDLSAITGETVSNLVVMEKAMQLAGRSGADIPILFSRIAIALSGVNEEGQPTSKVWRELGLDMATVRRASPLQQVEMLTTAFGKLKDPVAQADMAMRLFGRGGAEFLVMLKDPKMLGDARRMVGDLGKDLEVVAHRWDKLGDRLSVFSAKAEGVLLAVMEKLGPYLEYFAEVLEGIDPGTLANGLMLAATAATVFTGALATAKVVSWAREIAGLIPLLGRVAATMRTTAAAGTALQAGMSLAQVADASAAWGIGGSASIRARQVAAARQASILSRTALFDGGATGMLYAQRAPLLAAAPSMAAQVAGSAGGAGVAATARALIPTIIGAVATVGTVAMVVGAVAKLGADWFLGMQQDNYDAQATKDNILASTTSGLIGQIRTMQGDAGLADVRGKVDHEIARLEQFQKSGDGPFSAVALAGALKMLRATRETLATDGQRLAAENRVSAEKKKQADQAKAARAEWQAANEAAAESIAAMEEARRANAYAQVETPTARIGLLRERLKELASDAGISEAAGDPMRALLSRRDSLMADMNNAERAPVAAAALKEFEPIYAEVLQIERELAAQRRSAVEEEMTLLRDRLAYEKEHIDRDHDTRTITDQEYAARREALIQQEYDALVRLTGRPLNAQEEMQYHRDMRAAQTDAVTREGGRGEGGEQRQTPALAIAGDRLSRIGGLIGMPGNQSMNYARRTYEGIEKLNRTIEDGFRSLLGAGRGATWSA